MISKLNRFDKPGVACQFWPRLPKFTLPKNQNVPTKNETCTEQNSDKLNNLMKNCFIKMFLIYKIIMINPLKYFSHRFIRRCKYYKNYFLKIIKAF